jgi:integrase/recombinase XerD
MLEKIFDTSGSGPSRVRFIREGLYGSFLDRFSSELLLSRYANITARRHLRSAEHFGNWASHQHIAVAEWDESLLDRLSRHLRLRRCSYGHTTPRNQLTGAALFLKHLRTRGIIDAPPIDRTDRPALLVGFRGSMRDQRGTQDTTLAIRPQPFTHLAQRVAVRPQAEDRPAVTPER